MEANITRKLALLILLALPLVSGCFGTKGVNPVADTSLSQATSNALAQSVNASAQAARYVPPVTQLKKFSFAPPPHRCSHHLKPNCSHVPGRLKIKFLSASKADSIFITFEDLKVKPEKGAPLRLSVPERTIDLMKAADVSELLADLELPEGGYNYFEISIQKASIVVDGKSYPVSFQSKRIFFLGKFEIKEGFSTELTLKFHSKVVRHGHHSYKLFPVVKISSTLVPLQTQETEGDVAGALQDYISKAPISGVTALLSGGGVELSSTSDGEGKFGFLKVPAGEYSLKLSHPDYLEKSFLVQILAGQVCEVTAEMNPAIVRSTVGNTGWFAEFFPLADALGQYSEVSMETPVTIDFVSLAFVKAEVVFQSEFRFPGNSPMKAFLSSQQQVQTINNLGGWWVGNNALLGLALGDYFASNPLTEYRVEVTEYIRNNPSAAYFFAAQNTGIADIRIQNIQLSIYYR